MNEARIPLAGRHRRAPRTLAVVAVVSMLSLLVACGDGGNETRDVSAADTADAPSVKEDASEAAPRTTIDPAADVESARRALAAFEDEAMRRGFEVSEDDDDDSDLEFRSEECKALDSVLSGDGDTAGETADEESKDLVKSSAGGDETLSAGVFFADAEQTTVEEFALLEDRRVPGCVDEAIRVAMEEGEQAAAREGVPFAFDLRVDRRELPNVGDEALVIVAQAEMTYGPVTVPLSAHFGFARQHRAAVFVASGITGGGTPADIGPLLELLLDAAGA